MEGCDGGKFDVYSGQSKSPLNIGCVGERGIQLHGKKFEEDGGGEGGRPHKKECWEGGLGGQSWKGGGSDNG